MAVDDDDFASQLLAPSGDAADLHQMLHGTVEPPASGQRESLSDTLGGRGHEADDLLAGLLDDEEDDDDDDLGNIPAAGATPPGKQAGDQNPGAAKGDELSPEDIEFFDEFQKATGHSLSTKYKTRADAIKGLGSALSMIGQRDEMAEWGRQLRDNPEGVFQLLDAQFGGQRQQQQRGGQQADQQRQQPAGDVPEWDDAWAAQVEYDANGNLVAKQGATPGVVQKVKKFIDWRNERQQQLLRDPTRVVLGSPEGQQYINERVQEAVKQALAAQMRPMQEHAAQQAAVSEANDLVREEASWAFVEGNFDRKELTPAGKVFKHFLETLGSPDPRTGQNRYTSLKALKDHAKAETINYLASHGMSLDMERRERRGRQSRRAPDTAMSRVPREPSTAPTLSLEGLKKHLANMV